MLAYICASLCGDVFSTEPCLGEEDVWRGRAQEVRLVGLCNLERGTSLSCKMGIITESPSQAAYENARSYCG